MISLRFKFINALWQVFEICKFTKFLMVSSAHIYVIYDLKKIFTIIFNFSTILLLLSFIQKNGHLFVKTATELLTFISHYCVTTGRRPVTYSIYIYSKDPSAMASVHNF